MHIFNAETAYSLARSAQPAALSHRISYIVAGVLTIAPPATDSTVTLQSAGVICPCRDLEDTSQGAMACTLAVFVVPCMPASGKCCKRVAACSNHPVKQHSTECVTCKVQPIRTPARKATIALHCTGVPRASCKLDDVRQAAAWDGALAEIFEPAQLAPCTKQQVVGKCLKVGPSTSKYTCAQHVVP